MKLPLLTPETMSVTGQELLDKIQDDFIGLDTQYTLVDGQKTKRIYLDTTASSLMIPSTPGTFLLTSYVQRRVVDRSQQLILT